MKSKNTIIFAVLITIALAVVVYLLSANSINQPKTLRQTIGCANQSISDSVLNLDSRTSLIGAFISFEGPPDDALRQKINQWEIVLDESSWIFDDSVLAQIPTRSLCALAGEDQVRSIFIPEDDLSR